MSKPNPSTLSERDVMEADLERLDAGTLPLSEIIRYARLWLEQGVSSECP